MTWRCRKCKCRFADATWKEPHPEPVCPACGADDKEKWDAMLDRPVDYRDPMKRAHL